MNVLLSNDLVVLVQDVDKFAGAASFFVSEESDRETFTAGTSGTYLKINYFFK